MFKYLVHPYTILKSLNVGQMFTFNYIFIYFYFQEISAVLGETLEIILFLIDHHWVIKRFWHFKNRKCQIFRFFCRVNNLRENEGHSLMIIRLTPTKTCYGFGFVSVYHFFLDIFMLAANLILQLKRNAHQKPLHPAGIQQEYDKCRTMKDF